MASTEQSKKDKFHHKKEPLKHKNKDKFKQIPVEAIKAFVEDTRKELKSGRNTKDDGSTSKSNENLRGSAMCLLIKGLPLNVKVHKLKKDLSVTVKSINLSKKEGQRSALVTFKSVGDCVEAFDALKGYSYQGHSTVVSFVRPRSVVDRQNIRTPACFDFLLNVTNIPFHLTLEHLKTLFPKAEAIIQRCRHDRSFKG
ncbi:unnamed protein product [Hymenolepis diminuta]|uniref:RRM domain-containing protein n=1 Tax=Hymenolepis diminuta TaxID=6216 RepID=A0A0R3SM02_HYMDI|nr:unnamed protein product [Hymenolepis diminuta]